MDIIEEVRNDAQILYDRRDVINLLEKQKEAYESMIMDRDAKIKDMRIKVYRTILYMYNDGILRALMVDPNIYASDVAECFMQHLDRMHNAKTESHD